MVFNHGRILKSLRELFNKMPMSGPHQDQFPQTFWGEGLSMGVIQVPQVVLLCNLDWEPLAQTNCVILYTREPHPRESKQVHTVSPTWGLIRGGAVSFGFDRLTLASPLSVIRAASRGRKEGVCCLSSLSVTSLSFDRWITAVKI